MTIRELTNAMIEGIEDERIYDMCEKINDDLSTTSRRISDFEERLDFAYAKENYEYIMADNLNKLYYEV